MILSLSHR